MDGRAHIIMAEENTQKANATPSPPLSAPNVPWRRRLAITAAVVFFISSVFPVVAAFVKDTSAWPKWWGVVDVAVAVILAVLAFAILGLGQGMVDKQD